MFQRSVSKFRQQGKRGFLEIGSSGGVDSETHDEAKHSGELRATWILGGVRVWANPSSTFNHTASRTGNAQGRNLKGIGAKPVQFRPAAFETKGLTMHTTEFTYSDYCGATRLTPASPHYHEWTFTIGYSVGEAPQIEWIELQGAVDWCGDYGADIDLIKFPHYREQVEELFRKMITKRYDLRHGEWDWYESDVAAAVDAKCLEHWENNGRPKPVIVSGPVNCRIDSCEVCND